MSFADRPADASLCPLRILPNDVEVFVGRRESAQLLRLVEKRGLAGADHGAGAVLDEGLAGLHGGVEAVDPGSHLGCLLGGLSGRFHAGELAAGILQEPLIHRERATGERCRRFYYGRSSNGSGGGLGGSDGASGVFPLLHRHDVSNRAAHDGRLRPFFEIRFPLFDGHAFCGGGDGLDFGGRDGVGSNHFAAAGSNLHGGNLSGWNIRLPDCHLLTLAADGPLDEIRPVRSLLNGKPGVAIVGNAIHLQL